MSMKCAWLGMQGFLVEAVPGPLPAEGGRLLLHKEGRPRGRGHMFHCCLTMIFPQQLLTVSPRLTILCCAHFTGGSTNPVEAHVMGPNHREAESIAGSGVHLSRLPAQAF